ncbi:MAG TPA: hypothetical protein DCO83_06250 [Mucilaginibacter sp.]|jgi:hypothetical protein|nr:hypothetical protein [Mucilaginibacter sp.]
MAMETLTIEIPDNEAKVFREILEKYNIKTIKTEVTATPNALTVKTINDAHNGIGIEGPIENIRSFINSL